MNIANLDLMQTVCALLLGMGVGALYFFGLRVTIGRALSSSRPVLLSLVSFYGRLFGTVAAFYLIMDGSPAKLVAALTGFLLVRFLSIMLVEGSRQTRLPLRAIWRFQWR